MQTKNILDHFEKVDLPDPVDTVIEQIKQLIHIELIKPGDRLPSEKKLEDKLGLPRCVINRAFRRLETYGIVQTMPQSGTFVAKIEKDALEGLMANVIKINEKGYDDLNEIRSILEAHAAYLVARNATDNEIFELEEVQKNIVKSLNNGTGSFDTDMIFHLKLAAFSGNQVLKSVLTRLIINSLEILNTYNLELDNNVLQKRLSSGADEHAAVLLEIKNRNPDEAAQVVLKHFKKAQKFRTEHK